MVWGSTDRRVVERERGGVHDHDHFLSSHLFFFFSARTHMSIHQFLESEEYQMYRATRSATYNRVRAEDFLIGKVLGGGGFGVVCKGTKVSTGKQYVPPHFSFFLFPSPPPWKGREGKGREGGHSTQLNSNQLTLSVYLHLYIHLFSSPPPPPSF